MVPVDFGYHAPEHLHHIARKGFTIGGCALEFSEVDRVELSDRLLSLMNFLPLRLESRAPLIGELPIEPTVSSSAVAE